MDFVDWCTVVWDAMLAARRDSQQVRANGIAAPDLARCLFPDNPPSPLGFFDSSHAEPRTSAVLQALIGLQGCGVIESTALHQHWKVTGQGRSLRDNLPALWQPICAQPVDDDCIELLSIINRLSPQGVDDYVVLEPITREQVLGAAHGVNAASVMAKLADLSEAGLIGYSWQFDFFQASATYRGLVWETRRGLTLDSQFIDSLVEEWETTSVEFKRELFVGTADTKAEFIRDILGLANALASGRRWFIVGFDDTTRTYLGPPDPALAQDRLQQIVDEYIAPHLDIRYTPIDYRLGIVGQLEVRPARTRLPYRVQKDLMGKKKQIIAGTAYTRHGAHTVPATEVDLEELATTAAWQARTAPLVSDDAEGRSSD